jgi:hypothetical protein
VVSTGAPTPALFGFQSPGDYATFNSNHTPDGTTRPAEGILADRPLPRNTIRHSSRNASGGATHGAREGAVPG